MLMYFAFRWKHRDGAMVEFEPDGVSPTKVRKVPQDSCQQPGRKAFSPKGEVECTGNTGMKAKRIAKRGNFVSRNEKAEIRRRGSARADRAQGPVGVRR